MASTAAAVAPAIQESPEALARLAESIIGERNPRGIPAAVFVESVEAYMNTVGIRTIEPLVGSLQQLYSKYKFMETNLQKSRESFKRKIPETEKDLAALKHLMEKQEEGETIATRFNLADNVYAKATVDCSVGKVCIWLGANVMVEYSYEEALELLENNISVANERLSQIDADLAFLRDSIITTEVNIARIFNHDVRRRRKEKDDNLVAELEAKATMSTERWSEQAHASHEDATLTASDWEVRHDETSGAAYFFNVRTGESSWEAPTGAVVSAAESQQSAHEAVPVSEAFDESSQRVYYMNLHTAETRWEPPPGYASGHGVATAGEGIKVEKEDPRMSTAEQMEKLNRLLSGDDDDDEEDSGEQGGEPHEVEQTAASGGKPHEQEGEQAPSTPSSDPTAAAVASPDMPWMMFLNESDGIPYYYNHVTGDCVWDPPDEFVAYHQLQDQQPTQEEGEGSHQNFVETEAETAQRESARSGMEESPSARQHQHRHSAASPPPSLEKPMITPEFEEEVCRAIESVSKTPVGSSRVLFVRTPSEKWPEFSSKGGEDAVDEAQARTDRGGGDPATDTETSEVVVASPANDEKGRVELIETPSSQLVESYDPETGTFMHVMEPLILPDQHQEHHEQSIPPIESCFTVDALETDRLSAMSMQLRFEEAALVIECMVRCFLARHRVQKNRIATTDKMKLLAASDEIEDRQEVADAINTHEASVELEVREITVTDQPSAVALDGSMETSTVMPPAALPVADQGTDFSVQEEEQFAPVDADAELPTETSSTDETSRNSVEPTPVPQQEVSSPPDQVGVPQTPELHESFPSSMLLEQANEEPGAPDLVSERPTRSPDLPATPSTEHLAPETLLEQQTHEIEHVITPTNLIQAQEVRVDGERTPTEVVPSTPAVEAGGNARVSTADESRQKRASRPPSAASTVSTSRVPASSSTLPSAPGVLGIAQYFQRPPLKAVSPATEHEPADRQSNSTAPVQPFIVRKRVEIPELKARPAVPHTQTTLISTAERQARKEQQMQLASAASARKRELVAQEMREFHQLYHESAEKYKFDKQQALDALAEETQRLKSDELMNGRHLSSASSSLDKGNNGNNQDGSSSSIWELLADITSAASTSRNSETSSSQTCVSQLLNPETYVGAMKSERLRDIQQRIERLQTLNQTLETQLEAIDMCLLHEDHFQPDDDHHAEANNATSKQTFQAKYASKLRRRQIELLRAIQFWQQQVASYSPSPQEPNGSAVVDGEGDRNPVSSYWDRAHSHYARLTNQSGSSESIRLLRDANGDSLLHLAVWEGRQDDVAKLITLSDDLVGMANMVDNTVSRSRPLHEACRGGHFEITRLLVTAGAMLDTVDAMGDTPLHVACRLGWTRIVHFLLTVAEGDESTNKTDERERGQPPPTQPVSTVLSCSLVAFFDLRNYKKRRAMDLATLPPLIAFLQQYESELPQDRAEHSDAQPEHAQLRHKKHTQRSTRKRSKTGKCDEAHRLKHTALHNPLPHLLTVHEALY